MAGAAVSGRECVGGTETTLLGDMALHAAIGVFSRFAGDGLPRRHDDDEQGDNEREAMRHRPDTVAEQQSRDVRVMRTTALVELRLQQIRSESEE